MTRQLVLIRHAKADDGPIDLDRPLARRGRRDAAAIGRVLARGGITPDRVLSSPARRAQQTWDGARSELAAAVSVTVDDRIYDNDVSVLWKVIRETPASIQTLALVGHNPSIAELAQQLDDATGDRDARQQIRAGYPTSAVAVYDVSSPWTDLHPHAATLRSFTRSRS